METLICYYFFWKYLLILFVGVLEEEEERFACIIVVFVFFLFFLILNKEEDAMNCYNDALSIDLKDLDAWYNKALLFHKRKQYTQAEYCYSQVLKIDPDFFPAINKRIDVIEKINKEK